MKQMKPGSIMDKKVFLRDEAWKVGHTNWNLLPKYTHLLRNVTRHSGLDAATEISFCFELRVQKHDSPGKAPVNNNCTLY